MKKTVRQRLAKAVAAALAVCTFSCAATVSSSALGINDLLRYIQCFMTGNNCNVTTITREDCTYGSCDTTSAQTETAKPAAPVSSSASSEVQAVLDLVNKERKSAGLGTLTLSDELCKAADIRAKEIVRSFSHTRPNGTSCFTVFRENGISYRYAGENIAYGQRSAAAVMNAWMNSSGHRANILGRNFGKIGISCYTLNGVKYWVQLFTN